MRLRQAEEIKRSLFCGVADRDEELLELDRAVDELELMMERVPRCWLPPLVPTNEALTGEKATTAITKHHIQAHSEIQPNPTPVHPFGSCVEDLFNHSYSKPAQVQWLWAPKSRILDAVEVGFPARREEILRFGHSTRHIRKSETKTSRPQIFL